MKKRIRLTESKLRRLIESTIKQLNEERIWYGNEKPFITIMHAAQEIMDNFRHTQEDGYETMNDDNYDLEGEIYAWAQKINDEAERYCDENAHYTSINGGEDW